MIRFAKKEELEAVSLLWEVMVKEKNPDADRNLWLKMTETVFDSDMYFLMIAIEGEKIIGFIDCMDFMEPTTGKKHGVGQSFYIMPEYRDTTVAGLLWNSMFAHAQDTGVQTLELACYPDMMRFWSRRGFKTEKIIMRRNVE